MAVKILHTGPLGVNTAVVTLCGNRVMIVDPGACSFCGDEELLVRYLDDQKLDLAAIVLTHGHFDHVSGLPFLHKTYPDIPILIHEADSLLLGADSGKAQSADLAAMGFSAFLREVSGLPEADGFLKDGQTLAACMEGLPLPGCCDGRTCAALDGWRVLHTPGHTRGSVCLYNESEKLLISGDTLFYMSWGRTDLPGGSEREIRQSLKRLTHQCAPDTRVYPGHDSYGWLLGEML